MKLLRRIKGSVGIKTLIGSACFWAWLDAFFMSKFFLLPESQGAFSELATVLMFAISIPIIIVAIVRSQSFKKLLLKKGLLIVSALLGTIGSLVLCLASLSMNTILLVTGSLCAAGCMACYQLGWGGVYSNKGARSASVFAAGGFACAIIIDTPLLFMVPEASAISFSLLPLISMTLLFSIDPQFRQYSPRPQLNKPSKKTLVSYTKNYLGISIMLLCGVVLVMISFGYMQHVISFSPIIEGKGTGGILIQSVRGLVSILIFVVILFAPQRSSIIYRLGILAMIAGFMMMPFLFGSQSFWVSGAILISGYTSFDLLVWVVFSHIAFSYSRDSFTSIAVIRLLAIASYAIGALLGIVFIGYNTSLIEFAAAETTLIGYLVVIAAVLVLSSEEMWSLFRGIGTPLVGEDDLREAVSQRIETLFSEFELTPREKEIAAYLALGRTQPWIAEHLSISENTVGSHVRRIYQKIGINDRQKLIDMVSLAPDSTHPPLNRNS